MSDYLFDTDALIRMRDALSGTGVQFRSLSLEPLDEIAGAAKQRFQSYVKSAESRLEQRRAELEAALSAPPEGSGDDGGGYSPDRVRLCEEAVKKAEMGLERIRQLQAEYEEFAGEYLQKYGDYASVYDNAVNSAVSNVDGLLGRLEKYLSPDQTAVPAAALASFSGVKNAGGDVRPRREGAARKTKKVSSELSDAAKDLALSLSKDRCARGTTLPSELSGNSLPVEGRGTEKKPPVLQFPGQYPHGNVEGMECDDNGKCFMRDGELICNDTFVLRGCVYRTDGRGNIVGFSTSPELSLDNDRELAQQKAICGAFMLDTDDAGHLVARILNGDPRLGNLVIMDYRINRSDYARMENYIVKLLKQNVSVRFSGRLEYKNGSNRPSSIICKVETPDGYQEFTFDNDMKGSLRDQPEAEFREHIDERLALKGGSVSSVKRWFTKDGSLIMACATITIPTEGKKNERDFVFYV